MENVMTREQSFLLATTSMGSVQQLRECKKEQEGNITWYFL